MKIVAVLEQFPHHNPQTSPDNMVNYINYESVIRHNQGTVRNRLLKELRRISDPLCRRISGMAGYDTNSLLTDIKVLSKNFTEEKLIHFFNGDITCKFTPYLKRNNTVITTYHQPPDFFYQFFKNCEHIKRLDGVLVTSTVQQELFNHYLPEERVFYVPLAVDTKLFIPPPSRVDNNKKICLFVGNWLRDFKNMREIIKNFQLHEDIEFHIITLEQNRHYFHDLKNVAFFSGLSIGDYLKELQMADLFVVPLKSCTSNLAMLEAMSCGLPIITTDVGGIRDYLDESSTVFHRPGDSNGPADSIADLLQDDNQRQKMSDLARKHAANFTWERISTKLKDVYQYFGATAL